MWQLTDSRLNTANEPEGVNIRFEKGPPVKVSTSLGDGTTSIELLLALTKFDKKHGVGGSVSVGERYIGLEFS